eukprot:10179047-Lingulodinium_polyedra.AAC.1
MVVRAQAVGRLALRVWPVDGELPGKEAEEANITQRHQSLARGKVLQHCAHRGQDVEVAAGHL